ncbi:MAG: hypothetical protein ACD_73C00141G0003 [uncultured bacterium]|nr:MAG: hypothetical protein ACD_73C00141G0003 [uncultured bacterium]
MNFQKSNQLFLEANQHLVGGVNSPVRAFKGVGGDPVFIQKAEGAYLYDADGNKYIDYVGSWGPAILGHAHPEVVEAVQKACLNGMSFGAPTELEIQLAVQVKKAYPSIDLVRFVSSGTEAVMGAIRVARGFTGRTKIIKFDGCYHGHADYLLVKAGSGAATLGVPDSAGVPADFVKHTLVARYNDLNSVAELLSQNEGEVAAIIVEPVVGNMGCILPKPEFLKGLREITQKEGVLLIFDEVMTGFRVALGGAQARFGIKPDLTTLGKIIGGGLPVGAYGGRKDIMEKVAPVGPVYQAGTLSGNPLAMVSGLATLQVLQKPGVYEILEQKGAELEAGFLEAAKKVGIALQFNRVGSMFSFYFSDKPVIDGETARAADGKRFAKVFHSMLEDGVYLAPSAFEAGFISLTHTSKDIEQTIAAFAKAI